MNLHRILRHRWAPHWWVLRHFRRRDLAAIGAAVTATEAHHRGELRIVIEGSLPWPALRADQSARDRAADLFRQLGVERTAQRSGILIYIQLVDRRVEILADQGIAARVAPAEWEQLCRAIEAEFRAGRWREGMLAAIARAGALLTRHFPAGSANPNELPDTPTVL